MAGIAGSTARQIPLFSHAREAVAGNDDVVKQRDVEEITGLGKLPGDSDIILGWRRVARGVVVGDDDVGSAVDDRRSEDLGHPHGGSVDRPLVHEPVGDEGVLHREGQGPHLLLGQGRHVMPQVLIHGRGRLERNADLAGMVVRSVGIVDDGGTGRQLAQFVDEGGILRRQETDLGGGGGILMGARHELRCGVVGSDRLRLTDGVHARRRFRKWELREAEQSYGSEVQFLADALDLVAADGGRLKAGKLKVAAEGFFGTGNATLHKGALFSVDMQAPSGANDAAIGLEMGSIGFQIVTAGNL